MAQLADLDQLALVAEKCRRAKQNYNMVQGTRDSEIRRIHALGRYTKTQIAEAADVSEGRVRQVLTEDGNDSNGDHAAST